MRIEEDVKLDFKDVLIRPKRSNLSSRKQVDLHRTYKFKHSGYEWTGVPIMAANMDGVGTFEMAEELYEHRMFTCLVKSYTEDQFEGVVDNIGGNYFAVSTGTGDKDLQRLVRIIQSYPAIHFICIDVANGFNKNVIDAIKLIRTKYPYLVLMVGNVCNCCFLSPS